MGVKPGYKQTEVGVIPEDWQVVASAEVVEEQSPICYGVVQVGSDTEGGVPIVAIKYVKSIASAPLHRTAMTLERPYHRSRVRSGDILISIKGTIGRVGLVPEGFEGNISRELARLRLRQNYSPQYVAHQFEADRTQFRILRSVVGTTRLEFSIATLRQFLLPMPPLPEQRAIAEALSDVDALLGALDRLIAKKRDIKQATMQQLLTGRTRLPGFRGEWENLQARDIGSFRGGSAFPLSVQGETQGDYPFFKVSDMNNEDNVTYMSTAKNWISERVRKHLSAVIFPVGSIVFAKVGAAIFLERKKILRQVSCLDNNMAAYILDLNRADVRYIHYCLLRKRLGDIVSTTALPALNARQLGEMPMFIPPLSEQIAIAEVLSDMDAEIVALERRREKTRAIKQGMMQELLTGRTRLVPTEAAHG